MWRCARPPRGAGTSTAADETAGHDHYKHDGHHSQISIAAPSIGLPACGRRARRRAPRVGRLSLVGRAAGIEPGPLDPQESATKRCARCGSRGRDGANWANLNAAQWTAPAGPFPSRTLIASRTERRRVFNQHVSTENPSPPMTAVPKDRLPGSPRESAWCGGRWARRGTRSCMSLGIHRRGLHVPDLATNASRFRSAFHSARRSERTRESRQAIATPLPHLARISSKGSGSDGSGRALKARS